MGPPATNPTNPPATYEDLLALPDHVVGELIDGVLYVSARPAQSHTLTSSVLGSLLVPPYHLGRGPDAAAGPGGWWILDEPELHFWRESAAARWRQVLVPDLAGWRRERLPSLADGEAAFTLAPDWVCEVSSPSTAALDRIRKMTVYAEEGVRHVWLVEPGARMIEVFRLEDGRWVRIVAASGDEAVRLEPFDDVPLELGLLWLPADPPAGPPAP